MQCLPRDGLRLVAALVTLLNSQFPSVLLVKYRPLAFTPSEDTRTGGGDNALSSAEGIRTGGDNALSSAEGIRTGGDNALSSVEGICTDRKRICTSYLVKQ